MPNALHFIHEQLLNPGSALGAFIFGIFYFGFALIGIRLVGLWSRKFADHPSQIIDKTSANFIGQLLKLGCLLLALIFYAQTVPTLHRLGTTLLASASVLSIIIGIAAQNTLGNLIAGIALLFYRPFGIGDVLVMNTPTGKETGTVKEFSLGYTKLVTEDGRWIIAPNSIIIASVLVRIK